jgi:hypothetical protein
MENISSYIADNVKVDFAFNQDEEKPPFGYFHPGLEGKLTWVCGEDAEGRLTSVFCNDLGGGRKETKCDYVSQEDALIIKGELVNAGWKKLVPPKVTFTDSNNQEITLNRAQRRRLKRKLKKIKNPFDGD